MTNDAKSYENDSLASEIDDMLSDYTPSEQSTKDDEEGSSDETETETEEEEDEGSEEEEEDSSDEAEAEATEDELDESEDSEEADEVGDEEGAGEDEDDKSEDNDDDDSMSREALYDELNRLAAGQLDLGEQSEGGDADKAEAGSSASEGSVGEESRGGDSSGANDSELDVFGDELDFDDVITKPEAFTKVMGRLANQTQQLTYQNVMRSMVGMVAQQVAQQLSLKDMADKFWAENEDLKPVQKYVGAVASAYQSKHPNKEIGVVFEETAKIVREKLGIKKGGGGNPLKKSGQRKRRSSPALVKGRSRRAKTQKTKPTKLQSQIDELIDEL